MNLFPLSCRPCRLIPAFGFLLSTTSAQEVVLDRYYVRAAPPAEQTGDRVVHSEFHTYLPIDVGAVLARESTSIAAVRRAGVASDVLVRGLGRDNVAVLLDGAPAYAACPGRMDPPLFHVSTPLVERVVVQEGPFDVRHGAAPGGSIAVESAEPPASPLLVVGALTGRDSLYAADFAAGGPLGASWRGLLGASYQEGSAYRDGSGRRITELPTMNFRPELRDTRAFAIAHVEAHAARQTAAGATVTLRASGNDARDVIYPALQMDAQRDRGTRLAVGYASATARPFADRWRLDVHHHRVEHDMSDARRTSSLGMWSARGFMMRTVAATTGYGVSAEAGISRHGNDILYGGDVTARNWVADNTIGANSNAMLPDATLRQAGAFVQAERGTSTWKWKLGLRIDGWQSFARRDLGFVQRAHATSLNERTDAAPSAFVRGEHEFGPGVIAFAGVGQGARAPDPQERYISVDRPGTGTDWVGNPRLGLVRSTEITAGARVRVGKAVVSLRAFQSWLDNFVLLGRLVPASAATANAARTESYFGVDARVAGGELSAEVPLTDHWEARLGVAGQRGLKRQLTATNDDHDLPDIPPWHGRAVLRWRESRWRLEAEAQMAQRQTHLDSGAGERPVPGYGVVHLRAEYALGRRYVISAGIENVFDRTYATHNAYTRDPFAAGVILNEPGRFAYARVQWKL